MNTLFDIEKIAETPKTKCKQCEYMERWYFGESTIIYYCDKRKSNRTANGKLKIKANNVSCSLFEQFKKV